jgi:hypothetical protein
MKRSALRLLKFNLSTQTSDILPHVCSFSCITQFNSHISVRPLPLPLPRVFAVAATDRYAISLFNFPQLAATLRLRRTTCLSGSLSFCHVKQHVVPNDTSSKWKLLLTRLSDFVPTNATHDSFFRCIIQNFVKHRSCLCG